MTTKGLKHIFFPLILLGCVFFLPITLQAQTVWYVDDDAPGDPGPGDPSLSDPNEDGSTEHPFDGIQEGIDAAAEGDVVLVRDGTYQGGNPPDSSRNRDLDFLGKAISLRSESGPQRCIIDCGGTHAEPHRGVVFKNGEGSGSVLQGFTIRNGFAFGSSFEDRCGGAVYIFNASPLITDNVIKKNRAGFAFELGAGGGIFCDGGDPRIINNTIALNEAEWFGGGISCYNGASPFILNNAINRNKAVMRYGGGIYCYNDASPTMENNTIEWNVAGWHGGGIACGESSVESIIKSNIIRKNEAGRNGGGIYCESTSQFITNNVIIKNRSIDYGGGIYIHNSNLTIESSTFSGNSAGSGGGGIYAGGSSTLLRNSILWDDTPEEIHGETGETPVVRYCDIQGGYAGEGNIDADPIFARGPLGNYYLSQIEAGQHEDSPCVDAGDPESKTIGGTTRTDMGQETGIIDMGYHYPLIGLALGPGPGDSNPPTVRVFPRPRFAKHGHGYEFDAFGSGHFGVNLTCGDVDRDGLDEIITGAGAGPPCGPHVRGFQVDGKSIPAVDFLAYGTHSYGVNVAAGDVMHNDTFDEIITGAGPGPVFGPHVRAFHYDPSAEIIPVSQVSFLAYDANCWGVHVTGGDIDGDGFDEIVTGAGPGPAFGPRVRGWNVDGGQVSPIPSLNFFAYSHHSYGVLVTAGDLDRDGIDEIVTAPGPSPVLDSKILAWDFDGGPVTQIYSLIAFEGNIRYGARVFVGGDVNADGYDDLVVGAGPDPSLPSLVKVFGYSHAHGNVTEWFSLQAFPSHCTHGTNVAAGRF